VVLQSRAMREAARWFHSGVYLMLCPDSPGLVSWLLVGMTNTMQCLLLGFGYASSFREEALSWLISAIQQQVGSFRCLVTDYCPGLGDVVSRLGIHHLYDSASFVEARLSVPADLCEPDRRLI
jgi:hypothetical protein